MSKIKEYWRVSGNRITRPRTFKYGSLIQYAIDRGFDADAVGWIFEVAKIVKFLRDKGYHVEYIRKGDEDDETE